MADWIKEFALLVAAEFHSRPVVASLATVDAQGRPRVRMIIVRHTNSGDGSITMTTDLRSAKVEHLARQPSAELLVWSPNERQQFRVLGPMEVVRDGQARLDLWQSLRDNNRAMFFWPTPGEPRRPGEAFVPAMAADVAPPESFVLLVLRPTEVESLELNDSPHRRRRWREAGGWAVESLNP